MKPDRLFVLLQTVAAMIALALVTVLVPHAMPDAGSLADTATKAVALGLALLVLGFFNVWLPRGDVADTTAPIAFAAALILPPILAAGVVLLARCATVALRPRGHTLETIVEQTGRRALLISGTFLALGPAMSAEVDPAQSMLRLVIVTGAALVFIIADTAVEQLHAAARFRTPVWHLIVGAARLQGWMLAAEVSTAALAVIAFPSLSYWGLLVTVGLLLVMRQSFAMLLEVRASYTATVEVLARSLEAYDPERRGHAERVARMSEIAARSIGLQGKRLQSLQYAAWFHDVDRIGVDTLEEQPARNSAEVLAGVGFLAGAIPVLRILDTAAEDAASLDESDLIGAYLVARLSAFDSDFNSGIPESAQLANAIGSRLYSSTRAAADRAIALVERDARAGSLPARAFADVMA